MTVEKDQLLERWGAVLEGISDQHLALTTAKLLDNQAKAFMAEKINEETLTPGATTVGKLGTFQKWAFPMIRRIFPELVFNKIGATQAMDGPVSQIFYQGHSRSGNKQGTYGSETVYSKYKLTYRNLYANQIGSVSSPGTAGTWGATGTPLAYSQVSAGVFSTSNVLDATHGSPSTTVGGQIASWPDARTTLGWSVSAGEQLRTSGIPEITMHIQKQTVQARTRKMRALWTMEAAQDLKAYHNMDLENELTQLLTKELSLEIDRELIEDIRMIAYGFVDGTTSVGGWYLKSLINGGADNFPEMGGVDPNTGNTFTPGAFEYDFAQIGLDSDALTGGKNVFVCDLNYFTKNSGGAAFAPQHLGQAFANLLATINFASNDIYKTTFKGPGTVLITGPVIASILELAAKMEGGLPREASPTNMAGKSINYVGKFFGKYDLIVDPMFPDDEIIVAYKGDSNMDAGFVYCPYIPMMPLPTVTDPETFQPRKGILTRYGKVAVQPANRYFRVVRVIGAGGDLLTPGTIANSKIGSTSVSW